ncbi:susD family protein [Arenibacter sp. NBRC 103722]|uniref:RagB/SusD family nutrient uptake outer membrane protein n=1 Tax=Arenibacter sp. NBRC 103722 TaxID=1113929 RepID=UPI000852BEAF|nr:RagB/SusD family nutrient uptake outer membrane protein [Arenibacter sp. NBRC 103722]GBF19655.1 susD family protein [Arenibacter sp. NBRC 103722]
MKLKIQIEYIIAIGTVLLFPLGSCERFVDVEVPDHRIASTTVFANDETAINAINGIYNQLFNTSFSSGGNRSVTFLAGLSADNFQTTSSTDEILEFAENDITVANSFNKDLWSGAYNMIYMLNSILEGIEGSISLSEDVRDRIEGEAKFVRAFTNFHLAIIYGDIPLLLTSDYRINAVAPRNTSDDVYQQVLTDLEDAIALLETSYPEDERTRPNKFVAMAMLARVYLYLNNWQKAENYSSLVIDENATYEILENHDSVFLANSREGIWQISPVGSGNSFTHTNEGNLFIKTPTTLTPVALSNSFIDSRDVGDERLQHWVGMYTDDTGIYYFPNKYKVQYDASGGDITEYSMVLRLAEQYLIRSEARAKQGNLIGAMTDLDVIRKRSGLEPVAETAPNSSEAEVLEMVLEERRSELFAEWGHRWFDLRRTNNTATVLKLKSPNWQDTDALYPIPEDDRIKNPNLDQNPGYSL